MASFLRDLRILLSLAYLYAGEQKMHILCLYNRSCQTQVGNVIVNFLTNFNELVPLNASKPTAILVF